MTSSGNCSIAATEAKLFRFTESRLDFRFEAPWNPVFHWDKLPSYRNGLGKLSSTSAVDFIALHGSDPYFIEVKNFCDYRIDNKERLTSGKLVAEIANNVRDSIAGLVWAMERGENAAELAPVLRQVFAAKSKCKVVLWLEEDPQPRPADRSALAEAIKGRLSWLKPHVSVRSRSEPLPGLEVVGESPEPDARE